MGNQNGKVYGLTLLCPIINDETAVPSHDLQIRDYLAQLPTGADSPFAIAPGTHLARLVVMDDVIYVGAPACEEHLKSKYLIFETNCDADLDTYMTALAKAFPKQLDAIWSHCTNYPGAASVTSFVAYMKACQIETTFFFAATNDKSRDETLTALQTQRAVSDFITNHQGMAAPQLQREFLEFAQRLKAAPQPMPAAIPQQRNMQTGGRNE
jgi:hypothetical protein